MEILMSTFRSSAALVGIPEKTWSHKHSAPPGQNKVRQSRKEV